MRSVCTESLQGEHSGVNRLNVNNSIVSISVKNEKKKSAWGYRGKSTALFRIFGISSVKVSEAEFLNLSFIKGLAELR